MFFLKHWKPKIQRYRDIKTKKDDFINDRIKELKQINKSVKEHRKRYSNNNSFILASDFQLDTKIIPYEIYFIIFSYLEDIRQYRGIDKHTTNVIDSIISYYENTYNKICKDWMESGSELINKLDPLSDAMLFYSNNYKEEYIIALIKDHLKDEQADEIHGTFGSVIYHSYKGKIYLEY